MYHLCHLTEVAQLDTRHFEMHYMRVIYTERIEITEHGLRAAGIVQQRLES